MFNTHCGRYHFLCMEFGLKMSHDVFQMCMDRATDCLLSIIAIMHDDICIYGHTPREHDQHLLQLMKTAKQHIIIFNNSDCQIRQSQITFYGAVFTTQGMWPDPYKIQVLQDLPTPDSPVKLQSFLGLINYLQPFIPGLSDKSIFFVTAAQCKWDWNPLMDAKPASASRPRSARPSSNYPHLL